MQIPHQWHKGQSKNCINQTCCCINQQVKQRISPSEHVLAILGSLEEGVPLLNTKFHRWHVSLSQRSTPWGPFWHHTRCLHAFFYKEPAYKEPRIRISCKIQWILLFRVTIENNRKLKEHLVLGLEVSSL